MQNLFKHEGKKDAILKASLSLFAQRGYDAVSVRDIAKAAAVSEAALYKHFKGKEEMALYIFRLVITYYTRQLEAVDRQDCPELDKLCRIAGITYDLYEKYPDEITVALLSQYLFWEKVEEQIKPHFILKRILQKAMEKREIPEKPVYLWISLFSGLMLQPLQHYRYFADALPGLAVIKEEVEYSLRRVFS